jgi:hypothetical protein
MTRGQSEWKTIEGIVINVSKSFFGEGNLGLSGMK